MAAVIYRPLKIQQIIHYILAAIKIYVENDCNQRQKALTTTAVLSEIPYSSTGTKKSSVSLHSRQIMLC